MSPSYKIIYIYEISFRYVCFFCEILLPSVDVLAFSFVIYIYMFIYIYIDGLVQDCSNSIANELELLQSCTKPSIYIYMSTKDQYSCFMQQVINRIEQYIFT